MDIDADLAFSRGRTARFAKCSHGAIAFLQSIKTGGGVYIDRHAVHLTGSQFISGLLEPGECSNVSLSMTEGICSGFLK